MLNSQKFGPSLNIMNGPRLFIPKLKSGKAEAGVAELVASRPPNIVAVARTLIFLSMSITLQQALWQKTDAIHIRFYVFGERNATGAKRYELMH